MLFGHCAALSLLALAGAQVLPSKHAKLDFSVHRGSLAVLAQRGAHAFLQKRDDADGLFTLELTNEQTYYRASLLIGSQGDQNEVLVDTGSSDLWVMSSSVSCSSSGSLSYAVDVAADGAAVSRRRVVDFSHFSDASNDKRAGDLAARAEGETSYYTVTIAQLIGGLESATAATAAATGGSNTCTAYGALDTSSSDSFSANSSAPGFSIEYADGTFAIGTWGTDTISVSGGANVSDVSFAVVNDTDSDFGVLGIGLVGLETTYSGSTSSGSSPYTYENYPVRLKSSGAINKVLYSLYLNTADALSGSVLFGAVDHAKYSGELQTVPVVNIYSAYYSDPIRLDIVLDSITLESSSQNVTVSLAHIPALLDSGTTLTYLPSSILSLLVSLLGASLSSLGYYKLSCDYNTDSAYAVFNFSGVEIKVPMLDLILTSGLSCYLGVLSQSADSTTGISYAVLGDNFLRNAYLVYDLEDYEISLAQVSYSSDEDIEVVTSSVPLAVKAAGYSLTSLATSLSSLSDSLTGFKSSEGVKPFRIGSLAVLVGVIVGVMVL